MKLAYLFVQRDMECRRLRRDGIPANEFQRGKDLLVCGGGVNDAQSCTDGTTAGKKLRTLFSAGDQKAMIHLLHILIEHDKLESVHDLDLPPILRAEQSAEN